MYFAQRLQPENGRIAIHMRMYICLTIEHRHVFIFTGEEAQRRKWFSSINLIELNDFSNLNICWSQTLSLYFVG